MEIVRARLVRGVSLTGLAVIALAALVSCEIVQSSIPITLEGTPEVEQDAGDPGLPSYPGQACGEATATLCTTSVFPAAADDAGAGDAATGDGGAGDAGAGDAAPEASADAAAFEWCALRCFRRCGDQAWECYGPVLCGSDPAERPPACRSAD